MLSAPLLLRNNLAPGLAAKKTALRRPVGAPLVVTRVAPPIAGQRDKDDQVQAISTGAGTPACNTPVLSGGGQRTCLRSAGWACLFTGLVFDRW